MKKRIPHWLKGGILGAVFVLIVFFIKSVCDSEWCFADIFLPITLVPLIVLNYFLDSEAIRFLGKNIFWSILFSWVIIGALSGFLIGHLKTKKALENDPDLL